MSGADKEGKNETESGSAGRHVVKGEFRHKGILYCDYFPLEDLEKIPDVQYKADDVILATYPKCGTTWMSEILYSMMKNTIPGQAEKPILALVPFIEFRYPNFPSGLEKLSNMSSPRIIKTHLRTDYFSKPLDQGVKFVIVLRNVKDALVSYYHYYKQREIFRFDGDFAEFFELFRDDHMIYGDWYDWTLDWWSMRDRPNVLFVYYEDMKADVEKEIRRVADFLGKDISDDRLKELANKTDFDKLKAANKSNFGERVGKQMRKGIVGDWKEHFSEEQLAYVDALSETKLTGTGLNFRYT